MKKHNPYKLPPRQIWTDMDLFKFSAIAFVVGFALGALIWAA